jgi:hypothetical protein
MSNSQEMSALMRYSPNHKADILFNALAEEDQDTLHALVDDAELATARYMAPSPDQEKYFRQDLLRYFGYMRAFIDIKRNDGVVGLLKQFDMLFRPAGKTICGGALKHCWNTVDGNQCKTPYGNVDVVLCPACSAPRRLCQRKPVYNSRCKGHGGHSPSGILFRDNKKKGRINIYERNLSGKLQRLYIEAVTDPDYLSVAPEIGALSIRFAELLSELGESDYTVISTRMQQGLRSLRKAVDDKDGEKILVAADKITETLKDVSTDRKRWDEMGLLSGRLGRLAETERKRIVEAQQMITVTEMYTMQQDMLENIRDSSSAAALFIYEKIVAGQIDKLNPTNIRRMFLLTLHDAMEGKKLPTKILSQELFDEEDEEDKEEE